MNFLSNIILKVRELFKTHAGPASRNDQEHVMSEEEKLDQAIEESFPASDPPGHISKSAEDLKQY